MDKNSCLTEITLLQLRTFLAVVENRGIRKAAEALYLDPSTAHSHLHNLEASLGLKLVVFNGKDCSLTKGGEILYESTRRVADTLLGAVDQINNLTAGLQGRLRVITTIPLATCLVIPTVVEVFKAHFPLIEVELMIGPTLKNLERLYRGECDLAIAENPPAETGTSSFVCREYFVDRLIAVKVRGSAPHPKTLLCLAKGDDTPVEIAEKYGIEINAGIRYNDYEEAKRLGMESGGLVLISEFAILSELRVGSFERYKAFPPVYKRTFYFLYKKDPPITPIGTRFVDLCLNNLPYELARNSVAGSRS